MWIAGGEAVLDPHVGLAGAADRQTAEQVVALAGIEPATAHHDQHCVGRRGAPAGAGDRVKAGRLRRGAPVRRSSRRALRETQNRNR